MQNSCLNIYIYLIKLNIENKKNPPSLDNMAAISGKSQSSAGNLAGIGNLEKIRDIFFGSQMRNY